MFSEEKCELLKVNSKLGDATIQVNGKSVKTVRVVRYLDDQLKVTTRICVKNGQKG